MSAATQAPKERAAAQKALAIDDTLAEAHAVLAGADQDLWEWDAAEREFRRALELDPNNKATRITGTDCIWAGWDATKKL